MKHISRKLSLELVSLALVSLVLLFGFVCWRLSQGLVAVDFLKPVVAAEFHARTGKTLTIEHLWIGADGWQAPAMIAITHATVSNDANVPLATIDKASATFSRRALMAGGIHPIIINIDHPTVFLNILTPTETPAIGDEKASPDSKYDSAWTARLQTLLKNLAEPTPGSTFYNWDHAALIAGTVQLGQGADSKTLVANITGRLERTPVGLKGVLRGRDPASVTADALTASIEINRGQAGTASFHSGPLPVSTLSQFPSLAFLAKDSVPVETTLTANLSDTSLTDARLDLSLGVGEIVDPDDLPGPMKIVGGAVQMVYQAKPEHAEIRKLEIDLGGPKIIAEGKADTVGGIVQLVLNATIANMPLDSFSAYWPPDVSRGGRKWVTTNLSKGMVPKATIHLAGSTPRSDLLGLNVVSVTGTIAVVDATIHYFGDLPSVQSGNADITYDANSMTINMTGGHAEDFAIKGGTIILSGFSQHDQSIKIALDMAGPVASALDIIDHQPLGYAKKLQMAPASVVGTCETHLSLGFPLIDALKIEQLGLSSQSVLHDVSIPNAVGHLAANAINATLNADMQGMELSGTAKLIDIPLTLDYKQSFEKNGLSSASFSGTLDDRARGVLGIDFPDRLKGPVVVSGVYNAQGQAGSVDISVDFAAADFKIDEIGYEKPPNNPGSAKFNIKLQEGAITAIDPIAVEAPQFSAKGSAHFDPDSKKLTSLTLDTLHADGTNMSVNVTPLPDGGSKIDVSGSAFDARRFLHKSREKEAPKPEASATQPAPLEIDVALATVKTSDDDSLSQVKGQLILLGRKWRHADFTAMANGSEISLSYLPDSNDPAPSYTLRADAKDAGAAFSGFALTNSIKGGVLTVDGKKAAATEQQPDPPLAGTLTLTDFRLADPPGFARLFNLLSLTGFHNAVSSSDIIFNSLTGKFEIDDNQLRISEGRLAGAALGLTIAGTADRDAGTLNLYGTAVPAYGANRLINKIPLLGPLLTGGDGQGMFAAAYTITGPYEKPDVAVNPLSVFAPGVLRDLLFTPSDPAMATPDPTKK